MMMSTTKGIVYIFGSLIFSLVPPRLYCQVPISLNSTNGQEWKLAPAGNDPALTGKIISPGYDDHDWVKAVVPGAVFTSYVNAGLESDPNWGDNIYRVDQSKYNRNFWYRTTFSVPRTEEKVWLNFEGINRKGEVYLNGVRLGLLDGFMQGGKFDISALLNKGGAKNVLAVLVYWPTRPIANHASPTYISSDGWDWMPSVPGLLQGITDDVFLSFSGNVTFDDVWVRSDLASRERGLVTVNAALKNNSGQREQGVIHGVINPGNVSFSQNVTLPPGQSAMVAFDPARFSVLSIDHPRLWWPNGYGDPHLYTLDLTFSANGQTSDIKRVTFGIRKYSYDTSGGVFHININGERIFVKGGNWGMSEYMLRCRGEEYDLKVKLHREMNFNIIRNWIGSVTDEEFYDACDKYGIMVWDDFWLNSHPNLPDDVMAFNSNAVEKIKRFRNHPSIAVWCGDNEGYPLPPLNGWLREDVKTFDGGDRWYQANSHSDALTGSGPWTNFHPNWYFTKYPGGFGGDPGWGFRTEIGTAVFTNFESFKKFMPDSNWWPRDQMWDKHFFGPSAANAGPDRYFNTIGASYGEPSGIEDFCRKAQLVNIETNKALFEGWQHHMWDDASGVMTWMSQSAYPSFVWQTYDYYYDCTGAYWGAKKACEPLHIQWSYADNSVKVANTTLNDLENLTAEAIVYNNDGKKVERYSKIAKVNVKKNTINACFQLDFKPENAITILHADASSAADEAPAANAAIDGNNGSRWSSRYSDDEWICIDLGEVKEIASVVLNWESAYAKSYKLQVSADKENWKDVISINDGKGGLERVSFRPVRTRYVKLQGIRRATQWGYSLYEMEVYGKSRFQSGLSNLHFIKLLLRDNTGKILSDNFYWRSLNSADYTGLNRLPPARLVVSSKIERANGKAKITATIRNVGKGIAFANHVQLRRPDGERVLPVIMTDNYFTLLAHEQKIVEISLDEDLLTGDAYKLVVEPYNK